MEYSVSFAGSGTAQCSEGPMTTIITWIAILAVVAALGLFGAVMARAYMSGTSPAALLFKPRPDPRIEVVEQASMDGKTSSI